MTKLYIYDDNGGIIEIGLYELCKWWIETYPEDVFITEPAEVIKIRKLMQLILTKQRK
jgi:hypothetical protein